MKKESLITLFYILYFTWLLVVTFLNLQGYILNVFTGIIALFYLLFLKQQEDYLFFVLGALVPVAFAVLAIHGFELKFDPSQLAYLPLWLPIAWGTTIVALRRFFSILTN